jgi:hypothetical protein
VQAVEEIKRVYQVVTDMDNYVTIEAISDKGEGTYGYTLEGADNILFSVNDTEHLIDALTRATDWINKNSEETE